MTNHRTKLATALAVVLLAGAGSVCGGAAAAPGQDSRFLLMGGTASGDVAVLRIAGDGGLSAVAGSPFRAGLGVLSVATANGSRNVYVTQVGSQRVTGYHLGNDGTPRPIPGGEVAISGGPVVTSILTPDGSLLFVGAGGAPGRLSTFAVAADGALTFLRETTVAGFAVFPMVTVDPDGRFLRFTSAADSAIHSYAIGAGGELTSLGDPVPGGRLPVNPGYTPDGRFVYVSNEQGSNVSGFAIGDDGRLTPTPGSPYATGGMPHAAEVTADGRRVYIPEVAGAAVAGFSIGDDGALSPLPGSPYRAPDGSFPGLVKLADDERHLYVADCLPATLTTKVHTFDVAADGSLSRSALPSVDTGTIFGDGPILVKTP
ncbi:beta-propeller fold lactonase family protein [Nocardia sp. NPDC051833]|uniref:beta-propeller fold lactonase family protein n=1 Tax=Nocardia sp. NPDC051833 TaxID=3155674 RepID=UPI0034480521